MKAAYRVAIPIGAVLFLVTVYTHVAPQWLLALLGLVLFMFLAIALFISFGLGFFIWRKSSGLWMIPCLVCLALMSVTWLAAVVGNSIGDWEFKRHLAEFNKVVDDFERGIGSDGFREAPRDPRTTEVCTTRYGSIDLKDKPFHVSAVQGARSNDGLIVVSFLSEGSNALVHSGYAFLGYPRTSQCMPERLRPDRRWPYVRQVAGNWYHFSDQPGL